MGVLLLFSVGTGILSDYSSPCYYQKVQAAEELREWLVWLSLRKNISMRPVTTSLEHASKCHFKKGSGKKGDACFHAEMLHIVLFTHLIHMNKMNFTLNEHLGNREPITGQKAISAVFASPVVTWGQDSTSRTKGGTREVCEPRLLQGSWWFKWLKKRYKIVSRRKLFPNQLSGVPFE